MALLHHRDIWRFEGQDVLWFHICLQALEYIVVSSPNNHRLDRLIWHKLLSGCRGILVLAFSRDPHVFQIAEALTELSTGIHSLTRKK